MRIIRNFEAGLLALAVCFSACSCRPAPMPDLGDGTENGVTADDPGSGDSSENNPSEETMTIRILVGDKVFKADIEASETGKAFLEKLPLTLDMSELNGNEKYCYGVSLPRSDKYFGTIAAGDLMLYAGNCIVLFYGPAGGYSYTRIGRLSSVDGLAAALGRGSVTVTFEP